ncbi:MAG: hypothetical protein HC793_04405 [Aquincola sp.]|nr:hypothetical protein [Aquincola sp.]
MKRFGLDPEVEHRYYVTPGKDYLVLALTAVAGDSAYGPGVTVDVRISSPYPTLADRR